MSPITGYVSHCIALAVQYAGVGDAVPGAANYWGVRAYSFASIGAKAIRLRRDSDQVESDFVTITGGGLDLVAISSFKGAANLFVTTLYDQVGTSNLTQATAANQPGFTLNAIGLLPSVNFVSANSTVLKFITSGLSTPVSVSAVMNINNVSSDHALLGGQSNDLEFRTNPSNLELLKENTASIGTSTGTVSAATWYAVGGDFDGTNFSFYINGAASGSGTNAQTLGAAQIFMGSQSGTDFFDGFIPELAIYLSYLNSTQNSSLSSNQRSYWGF